MGYQPLEKLLTRSGHSIYKLVRMASKRAMELADGMPRLIENPTSQKTATIALEEILHGKVGLKEFAKDMPGSGAKGKEKSREKAEEGEKASEKEESVQV